MEAKKAKAKADSTSANCKRFILGVIKMIHNNDRYFFAKFLEDFAQLDHKHQTGLLRYMSDRYDQKKWKDRLDDTTMYNDVIRSMLFYFSGRDEIGQPSKKELAHALREYVDSAHFRDAEDGDESFLSSLETA